MNVLDFKKDMGLWHGVLTVSLSGGVHELKTGWCARTHEKKYARCTNRAILNNVKGCYSFVCSQAVMNRIHSISVPYAVMKACPLSWVQRVHVHKGVLQTSQDLCRTATT